jgi:menaquinone-dependent protoporphyrinogen oxidase
MKILILYGTTEGQTAKIAEFVAARLRFAGDEVTLVDASTSASIDVQGFQGAIVAASVHVGMYQERVVDFVRANAEWLKRTPSAFLSVSLSAVSSDAEEAKSLQTITENFKGYTGWTNAEIHHVGGAIRFGEYDFFRRWLMRAIAWEKGLTVTHGQDMELTNWSALGATVDALRLRFAAGRVSPAGA